MKRPSVASVSPTSSTLSFERPAAKRWTSSRTASWSGLGCASASHENATIIPNAAQTTRSRCMSPPHSERFERSQLLLHEECRGAGRKLELGEYREPGLLVERPCLEVVGVEPDDRAATPPALCFCGRHELAPVSVAPLRFLDPEPLDEQRAQC